MHTYSIHRDPRNFSPLPDGFWPERWLYAAAAAAASSDGGAGTGTGTGAAQQPVGSGGAKLVHDAAAFVPFSFGPANCAGKRLALLELRMVVCALVRRLELALAPGFDAAAYEGGMRDYFILTRPVLPVLVTRRRDACAV